MALKDAFPHRLRLIYPAYRPKFNPLWWARILEALLRGLHALISTRILKLSFPPMRKKRLPKKRRTTPLVEARQNELHDKVVRQLNAIRGENKYGPVWHYTLTLFAGYRKTSREMYLASTKRTMYSDRRATFITLDKMRRLFINEALPKQFGFDFEITGAPGV